MFDPLFLLASIIALAFLIVVHEGGHYFVARWCKMRIERFSIGFGPAMLKRKSKKTGTTFQLAPIPFGGFVEICGMNIAEEVDPEDRFAYPNRPVWQRFITIFAGPATNYLSAIVLAFFLYTCHGVDVPRWYGVGQVLPDYDAHGKLQKDDRILAIDGQPLRYTAGGHDLTDRVTAGKGAPLKLTILRKGETLDVTIQPHLDFDRAPLQALAAREPRLEPLSKQIFAGWPEPVWRIGVQPDLQNEVLSVGVLDAIGRAFAYPVDKTKQIGAGLYGIVFGKEKADPGGPIRMVEEFYHAFSAGIVPGLSLVMMLSVYLGMFNLLPVPALDGGRLVFLLYEMVTRRRANPKVETMVHMAGIMALGVVMILVLIIDIKRFL
ncbi:MAG TPA: M50 family metallopeptidase [Kofleriaceae bacterium]|nr:M50 family metallopeptidase [Kofleriaceae bacterium]